MTASTIIIIILAVLMVILVATLLLKRRAGEDQSLSIMQQQLIALQEQIRASLENTQTRLDQQLKANVDQLQLTHRTVGERLEGVSRIVGDRLEGASRAVTQLGERMMKVEEATKRVFEVGQDIASLQEILRAPKIRGGLGEVFLTDLLAQMLPQDAYESQYSFADGERVDAVIKTAHGLVPVDAKFPLEDFQRLSVAATDDERKTCRRAFIDSVKKRVAETVKYIRPGEGTFDFALMYVPAENVYYEIITRNESLGEDVSPAAFAISKKVIPVSPNTFYAYLNTILLGLKGMRVERFVSEIMKEMGKIRTDFGRFKEDFVKIGKHLSNASSSYDNADKRLNRLDDRLASLDQPAMEGSQEPKSLPPTE